jgi:hypothetical protein
MPRAQGFARGGRMRGRDRTAPARSPDGCSARERAWQTWSSLFPLPELKELKV